MNHPICTAIFFILAIAVSVPGCGSKDEKNEATDKEAAEPVSPAPDSIVYEAIPFDTFRRIATTADYVDIIFTNNPMSVAVDQIAQVKSTFLHYSPNAFVKPAGCQPDANVAILAEGEVLIEANIYITQCQGAEWIMDGQTAYGNELNQGGLQYYNGLIEQGRELMRQRQQGQ